jgi:hypothetical protein
MNDTRRPYGSTRARRIAAELEAWRGDRSLRGHDQAILAVTTGKAQEEDQEGTEEVYQVAFRWYDGKVIVRNGQDHEYQPPAKLANLLHDWCEEHCQARSFGYPAQEGFLIKKTLDNHTPIGVQ